MEEYIDSLNGPKEIENYDDFIKGFISTINSKTGSNLSQSLFTNTKIITYFCKECGRYPIISFFCEKEIGVECGGCSILKKKLGINDYLGKLIYSEKEIKCIEGEKFVCYCFDCNKDICNKCKNNEHKNHNIKDYETINKEDNIEELKKDIKLEIINEIKDKINPYYIKKSQDENIFQNK